MGLFEQFPYTNYHELNLDWIINTFKEKMESAVMSVNGMTGEVTLYQSPYVQFPDIPDTSWNVYRISDGEATGIQFRKGQPAQRIDHVNRYDIYDAGNPPPYPVTTVNGMSGDVYDFFMTANNILKFPEGTSNTAWELIREIANNTELGLRTQYDSVNDVYEAFICYKETGDIERYVRLLTPNDIPSSSGVVSFNGQTGVVTASGADLDINASDNTSIDQTITNIENDIAIIINGSTSAKNVTAGQYVLVQNSGMTGVNDGLYIANTTVSAGTPFTSAYLDAVSNGGLNSIIANTPEIVTNAYGTAYKYPSGMMICVKSIITPNVACTNPWGSLYESTNPMNFGTWPEEFIDIPIVSANVVNSSLAAWIEKVSSVTKSSAGESYLVRPTSATNDCVVHIVGFGRWK